MRDEGVMIMGEGQDENHKRVIWHGHQAVKI